MYRILVVEDNKDMQFILKSILESANYQFISVGNGDRAIMEAEIRRPDLVLLDMRLPGIDGLDVLQELRKIYPELLVIMMTAYADVKDAVSAMKIGAYDYITKPFDNEELLIIIQKALKIESLSRQVSRLKLQLSEKNETAKILGRSEAITKVLAKVKLIAPTNMSVILQGNSGTGKEVMARLIHDKSLKKNRSFVAVDCGAIPPTLLESELFGYEVGAFTGAEKKKIGKFEEADGGTLLLDEITNLSMDGQAKLLRALEERKINPIGSKALIDVDVRVIVTSNLNFLRLIEKGKFRKDLYHRLNEFMIKLPDLNQRKEDIPTLAEQFLLESSIELNKTIRGFSSDVLTKLTEYDWPGNVRELKHTIKRATLLATGTRIEVENIQIEVIADQERSNYQMALAGGETFSDIISGKEKELILRALEMAEGNKTKAAKILKLNRKTFYRKLETFGLKNSKNYLEKEVKR